MLTPPTIAKRFGVKADTVRSWIHAGELPAINVAPSGSKKPSFRVSDEALKAFEQRRSGKAPAKPKRRRRKRSTAKQFV